MTTAQEVLAMDLKVITREKLSLLTKGVLTDIVLHLINVSNTNQNNLVSKITDQVKSSFEQSLEKFIQARDLLSTNKSTFF